MMSNWADFPDDVLSLIFSNLYSIKDRCNVRLVCKSWNSVASVSPRLSPTPSLMFYQNSTRLWNLYQFSGFVREIFLDLEREDGKVVAEILCSRDGWLLISFYRYYLFFVRPSDDDDEDDEYLEATGRDAPIQLYKNYCFVHPPTSPDCIIVGLCSNGASVEIGVLKRGENNWSNYTFDNMRFVTSVSGPILHDGLLYYLDVLGNVGTFNIEERSTFTIHYDCLLPDRLRDELRHQFLIKLDGEEEGEEVAILAVFVYGDGKKVKVYKLLKRDMKWELVKSLGDKMLYVSRTGSFAETAPVKSMANKIVFPYLHDGDESVVYYSLDTKKYHSFGGKYSFSPRKFLRSMRKNLEGKWNGLRELPCATWITNVSPK